MFSKNISLEEINLMAWQGSILEPLLFDIFMCDSFEDIIKSLENHSIELFKWFSDNQIKANKDKYQVLISSNENDTTNVDGNLKKEVTSKKKSLI